MKVLKQALLITIVFVILCGIAYPLAMTGISQLAFNKKANGSILKSNGKEIGSELIGQSFTSPNFFRGRVSSINYNTYTKADEKTDKDGKVAYSTVSSGSSNLAPSNKELRERVQKDIEEFLNSHPGIKKEDIPTDLLTNSGSGLDPNISPKAAKIQIPTISKNTGISENALEKMVDKYTEGKSLYIFGEQRVNVLKLNLEIADILEKRL